MPHYDREARTGRAEQGARGPSMAERAREVLREELLTFWGERCQNRAGITPWKNPPIAELARFLVWLRKRLEDWSELEIEKEERNVIVHRLVPRIDVWIRVYDEAAARLVVEDLVEGRPRPGVPAGPPVRPPVTLAGVLQGVSRGTVPGPGGVVKGPPDFDDDEARDARIRRRLEKHGWGSGR